jgi:hypothetical protein
MVRSCRWESFVHFLASEAQFISFRGGETVGDAANADSLHAAKRLLLRDGALAYAIHAQLATLAAVVEAVDALPLPNPARRSSASSNSNASNAKRCST